MKLNLKKLGAVLTVIATSVFTPVIATAQEIELTPPASNQQVATESFIPPYEPDHYRQVDTSDWDFNEPGMNKNTIDNHELERTLPADLGDPQPVITPGKMRSDRIPLPEGVTKEEADQAEIQEAREQGITAPGQPPIIRTFAADNCRTYWPSSFQVCGAIRAKYESMAITWAGQTPVSFLGLPKSNELTNPDGVGKRTEFDNGFIYWHPDTGAWSVTTHNSIVWARNGWELGRLGYPTSDEIGTGDGVGRKQYFQRGRIYGSLSGVVSIEGKILEKWVETGEEKGPLGYPATDEEGTPDGVGRYNRFALGMIYWHPNHGAHWLNPLVATMWGKHGWERSKWGYPIEDSQPLPSGDGHQRFEHGDFDLFHEISALGSRNVNGKDISNLIPDIFITEEPIPNSPTIRPYVTADSLPFPNNPNVGGVTIPDDYEYRNTYGLDDFCTSSPDAWNILGVSVNFRGACARHDMCYIRVRNQYPTETQDSVFAPVRRERMRECDTVFYAHMGTVCINETVDKAWATPTCIEVAHTYWGAVVARHHKNYFGIVGE
ncbi:hypothetical protein [Corynebacterium epidermidicanis]|uniref:LGFP repeat protein n=1 Tax=Corynebacterium epidermidicanis TaxID=1050174 RepID=A0A0G3GS43_9CORY|nr:hypothetical protein [Corynebacterium epidermidicanis]AKK02368.1 hypothetical protein CEPID_02435 [Corynebacterium epidermidicanis]